MTKGKSTAMDKLIITVVGKDKVGIIAAVSAHLAKNGVNILDISQTVVKDFFNMMMIAAAPSGGKPGFGKISRDLEALGENLGLEIRCRKSGIFEMMHRI